MSLEVKSYSRVCLDGMSVRDCSEGQGDSGSRDAQARQCSAGLARTACMEGCLSIGGAPASHSVWEGLRGNVSVRSVHLIKEPSIADVNIISRAIPEFSIFVVWAHNDMAVSCKSNLTSIVRCGGPRLKPICEWIFSARVIIALSRAQRWHSGGACESRCLHAQT